MTVLGESVVSFFMGTVDDFDSAFPRPPGFHVGDFNAVLFFEMVLNRLGTKFRIRTELGEEFGANKLFIDVAVPRVVDAMTRMNLNCLANSPHVCARESSGIEVPGALFVFAFEGISIRVDLVWDKFIVIEKSGTGASVF